jgi:hypothetical protein
MDDVDDADDSKAAAIGLLLSIRATLQVSKVSELKKWLRSLGATEEQIDALDDVDDTKACAVELVLELTAGGAAPPMSALAGGSPGPAPAPAVQVVPDKYIAADNQIRLGQPEDSTHGVEVLLGLTDAALGQFLLDPLGAIRQEFALHGSAEAPRTGRTCAAL